MTFLLDANVWLALSFSDHVHQDTRTGRAGGLMNKLMALPRFAESLNLRFCGI